MKSVPHFVFVRIYYTLRLKTCGFLRFYILFSIFVSSLGVPLYASHSSAKNFRSKSLCFFAAVVFWRNQKQNKGEVWIYSVPHLLYVSVKITLIN